MEITDTIARVAESRSMTVPTAPSGRPPGDPLDLLLQHLRNHPRTDVAVLEIVDAGRTHVRPAATWFASPIVEQAIGPGLEHPYDHDLPGLVEATLERGRSLFLPRVGDWEAAPRAARAAGARRRRGGTHGRGMGGLCAGLGHRLPVRTPLGRALGVLGVASLDAARPFTRPDLDTFDATGRPGRPRARAVGADRRGIGPRPRRGPAQARGGGHGGLARAGRRTAAGRGACPAPGPGRPRLAEHAFSRARAGSWTACPPGRRRGQPRATPP